MINRQGNPKHIPEEWESQKTELPHKVRLDYKEGGFSLIWFDEKLQRIQMYSTGRMIGKTLQKISEGKMEE